MTAWGEREEGVRDDGRLREEEEEEEERVINCFEL